MASKDAERVYDGLAQVAHAIRRSTALTVAMHIMPPDATVLDLKVQAEDLASWIGGKAQQAEAEQAEEPTPTRQPLGEPWPPR
jgi:hypothetical protein